MSISFGVLYRVGKLPFACIFIITHGAYYNFPKDIYTLGNNINQTPNLSTEALCITQHGRAEENKGPLL